MTVIPTRTQVPGVAMQRRFRRVGVCGEGSSVITELQSWRKLTVIQVTVTVLNVFVTGKDAPLLTPC